MGFNLGFKGLKFVVIEKRFYALTLTRLEYPNCSKQNQTYVFFGKKVASLRAVKIITPTVTWKEVNKNNFPSYFLTLSWPAGHICPTYKESFQVRWDNRIPLFLHTAIYLEVSLFRWTSQNAFSPRNDTVCNAALQHCTQYHLHTAVSLENAFWLVQRNRDTAR